LNWSGGETAKSTVHKSIQEELAKSPLK